jgi:hypothetical protein
VVVSFLSCRLLFSVARKSAACVPSRLFGALDAHRNSHDNDERYSWMNRTLDTRQLHAFAMVARTGSFTEAARELHVTQSGVSHSMKALERHMGCRLLDRLGKKVVLTQAGEQRWMWQCGRSRIHTYREGHKNVPLGRQLFPGIKTAEDWSCILVEPVTNGSSGRPRTIGIV